MFYARGAVVAARAARSVGPTVAVSFIGARGGRRIPPAHAGGIATASERSGGDDACRVSGLCLLRTIDGMPGCAPGVVGGAFLDDCGSACRVTVARIAGWRAALFWVYSVWNGAVLAGLALGCWRCWQPWRRIRWRRVWQGCFWESPSVPWASGGWRS